MTNYVELYPHITPVVPLAPHATMLRAIQQSAIDFYRESTAYRFGANVLYFTIANQYLYDLNTGLGPLPANTIINKIITFIYNGAPLVPTSDVQLQYVQDHRSVENYIYRGANMVQLHGVPQESGVAMQTVVSLEPTFGATALADALMQEHFEGIIAGAIYRLLITPNQAWSDPSSAAFYQALFNSKIREARTRADGDHTPKVRVTTYGGY